MTVFFYLYSVTVHNIVLIYYCMLNQPCVHTWSWCTILFMIRFAAAAAKSLQSCPTLCNPIDGSPPGSPVPGILQGKNTRVGCHFPLQCMKVKSESEVTQSCPTLATPWTAAYQAPPSMGFSRQEYWSGVLLPSPTIKDFCVYICRIIGL